MKISLKKIGTHVCHYCGDYHTNSKMDMKRHFTRKKKCDKRVDIPYEEAKDLSLLKVFYMDFDINEISIDHKIQMIHKYRLYENEVPNYFPALQTPEMGLSKLGLHPQFFEEINEEEHNQMMEKLLTGVSAKEKNEIFHKLFFDPDSGKYMCRSCHSSYTTKANLEKHMLKDEACEKKSKGSSAMIKHNKTEGKEQPKETKSLKSHIKEESQTKENKVEERVFFNDIDSNYYNESYDNDEYYKHTKGYIYVIRIREFANVDKYIFKVGYTLDKDVYRRINYYPNGSEVWGYFYVSDARRFEKAIFTELDKLYMDKKELDNFKDTYGNEFYKIEPTTLMNVIFEVIHSGLIQKAQWMKDIERKRLYKLVPYFDLTFNQELTSQITDYKSDMIYQERMDAFRKWESTLS